MKKCTNLTYLYHKDSKATDFTKLCDITKYPDLGGKTEKLDVTTMSDTKKRTINGLESVAEMEFSAWFEKDVYEALQKIQAAGTIDEYQLRFGDENGVDGIFDWSGVLKVYPTSGAVNAVRAMTFTITDEGAVALHYVSSLT